MGAMFGGPMFQPASDSQRRSIFGQDGGHYNIYAPHSEEIALALLREWFPDGKANEMNFVLFSTSGVHGSYTTIEEIEEGLRKYPDMGPGADWPEDYHGDAVTFLLVQPRIVSMTYGNVRVSLADVPFLKCLRASSWDVVKKIGKGDT